ncbi:phage antirepressor protein, partial [Acinetobacter bereziniae]|nr:phage antirepressor protein [Acinetobacter bereziniae]
MSNLTLNTNNATAFNNTSIAVLDSSIIKMTSQEIADLVQSRHDNVKSSIEYLVSKGTIQCPVEKVIKNFQNRDMKVYEFEG